MTIKINPSLTPPENCIRFSYCQINKCPLDFNFSKLENDNSDPAFQNKKQKCVNKKRRQKIAEHYPELKNKGLTPREKTAIKKWNSLPESEKKERIAKLKKISPVTRLSEKGYAITRKKKNNFNLHIQNAKKQLENDFSGSFEEVRE